MKEDKLVMIMIKLLDKHSGYIIKFIEFDDSEGYDESGYKNCIQRNYA